MEINVIYLIGCQFLIGKVQLPNKYISPEMLECQFLIGKVQLQ